MNREDIIRMAREARLAEPSHPFNPWGASQEALERFAALVAAHEREACAKMAELVAREIDDTNGTATYIAKAIRAKRVAV